ncbi:MAG: hypothetical protein ACOYKA_03515 [Legionellaceae bacterium]
MRTSNERNQACADARIPYDLTAFNHQHTHLTQADYLHVLRERLKKELQQTQHRTFVDAPVFENLNESLAYLFNCQEVQSAINFTDEVSFAYAFIQATGFSTQNEASYLSMLDIYNTFRLRKALKETKNIVYNILIEPFAPLYREYKSIASREENLLIKVTRTLMPMLMVSGVIVATCALLAPLAIPDLAFLFILIPTLYLGLFVATCFTNLANSLYHMTRQAYYGGPYRVPEFQIKPQGRIIQGCGDSQIKAEQIQAFYIEAISHCDEIESVLSRRNLTSSELTERQENLKRRYTLQLEWYDMQTNAKLGIDKIPAIALNRIRSDGRKASQAYCERQVDAWMSAVTQSLNHRPVSPTFFSDNKIRELQALEGVLMLDLRL